MDDIWPFQREQLARLLHSHICGQLGELMDVHTFLDERGLPLMETRLGGDGYPLDSLSLLNLASHISRVFHLHEFGCEDELLRKRTLGDWCDLLMERWKTGSPHLTFFSSGSTGMPQPMCHRRETLLQEAEELAGLFHDTQRIIALVPAHHIYGFLFTLLLPETLKAPVVEGRVMGVRSLSNFLEAGDLIVSHPFQWAYLCRTLPQVTVPVTGVTSTAPCPPSTFDAVKEKGISRFVEVYGSSETAGIGWRERPDEDYGLFSFWSRGKNDAHLVRSGSGEQSLTVLAPDRLEWSSPRRFRVVGRRDGAVQVGGHNVYPDGIAIVITEHPEVARCTVRLMRPEEGDRLKAFIVPVKGVQREGLAARIYQWCRAELRPPQRPGHFEIGEELPSGEMGKRADWRIVTGT